MGVYIQKLIVTGVMYSNSDLSKENKETIAKCLENEAVLGGNVKIIEPNPYGGFSLFKDFLICVIDEEEKGSDERAGVGDDELIQIIEPNQKSIKEVQEQLTIHKFPITEDFPVKTYRVHYFT